MMQDPLDLDQFQCLEKVFFERNYISPIDERKLAADTGLSVAQVQTWFMNRRYESRNRIMPTRPDIHTPQQLELLAKSFLITRYPDIYMRQLIALQTSLTEPQVQAWFERRREKARISELASQTSAASSRNVQVATIRGNNVPCGSCGAVVRDTYGLNSQQLESLEKKYTERKYLTWLEREAMAFEIGTTIEQIRLWFQNRRKIEQDCNNLAFSQFLANTSREELINMPSRMPRWCVEYTPEQLKLLEENFRINKYMSVGEREALAFETDLTERQVFVWFQNERMKEARRINKAINEFNREEIEENSSSIYQLSGFNPSSSAVITVPEAQPNIPACASTSTNKKKKKKSKNPRAVIITMKNKRIRKAKKTSRKCKN